MGMVSAGLPGRPGRRSRYKIGLHGGVWLGTEEAVCDLKFSGRGFSALSGGFLAPLGVGPLMSLRL